jgi:arylsulfatase A-like enzyme
MLESLNGTAAPGRPNILLIMADQWAAASVGCYGCDVPSVTPNLDTLALRGVRFDRHYANVPRVRAQPCLHIYGSFAGGSWRMAQQHRNQSRHAALYTASPKQRYGTWGIGKFHFSPMQQYPPRELKHLGFDQVQITEDPKHGPWLEWVGSKHPEYFNQALAASWPMPYLNNYPPGNEICGLPGKALTTSTWRH